MPLQAMVGATGLMVVGINPRRAVDQQYAAFLEQLSSQTARAIDTARDHAEQKKRAEVLATWTVPRQCSFQTLGEDVALPTVALSWLLATVWSFCAVLFLVGSPVVAALKAVVGFKLTRT